MIVVVDGTGPAGDDAYADEMRGSFCSQIAAQPGGRYFRGPSLTGREVSRIADKALDAALALAGDGRPIMLAGYSRGGCAVINTAVRLQARGQRVAAMFLFDAVDMQTSELGLTQTIPDNVAFVAHCRSARDVGFWVRNPVRSRFYFYNTGRWLAGSGTLVEQAIVGSHGAVGGLPWSDIAGDRGCALAVADWMTPHLRSHGVELTLRVYSDAS
jgi:hypothetical protein